MRRRARALMMAVLLAAGVNPGGAQAAYKSLQRDGSANLAANAKVLVAPSRDDQALTIKRIRITSTEGTLSPSYRFFAKNSSKKEGETESLASCTLPGCVEILAAEAVQEGMPFDYDDLDITLMPGDRLYFYASADISPSDYITIEVWYSEGRGG